MFYYIVINFDNDITVLKSKKRTTRSQVINTYIKTNGDPELRSTYKDLLRIEEFNAKHISIVLTPKRGLNVNKD